MTGFQKMLASAKIIQGMAAIYLKEQRLRTPNEGTRSIAEESRDCAQNEGTGSNGGY